MSSITVNHSQTGTPFIDKTTGRAMILINERSHATDQFGGSVESWKTGAKVDTSKEQELLTKCFTIPPKFEEGVAFYLWAYWEQDLGEEFINKAYELLPVDGCFRGKVLGKDLTILFFLPTNFSIKTI